MNIARILKRMPSGTKIYSLLHGTEVELVEVTEDKRELIIVKEHYSSLARDTFFPDGSYRKGGECMLFPGGHWEISRLGHNMISHLMCGFLSKRAAISQRASLSVYPDTNNCTC